MKPKIAPTSPKTEAEHKEFEKFYTAGLRTIDQPRRFPVGLTLLLAFLFGVVGAAAALAGLTEIRDRYPSAAWVRWFLPVSTSPAVVPESSRQPSPSDVEAEAQRQAAVSPVIVGIYKDLPAERTDVADLPAPDRFRGVGVVASSTGLLVTTTSVIPEAAAGYSVLFSDHRIVGVDELYFDPASPFVFLVVAAENLRSAKFASEDAVSVGSAALAYGVIGLPDRLTAVSGLVSALDVRTAAGASALVESSDTLDRLLAVTPDGLPSGTPAFTREGEVIGLATETSPTYGQLIVPVWHLRAPLRQLLRGPDLVRPLLGLQTIELGRLPALADPALAQQQTGALIATDNQTDRPAVRAKSPAAQAGLRAGDIILEVNGTAIDGANPLSEVIQDLAAGETASLLYRRDGNDEQVKVKLGIQRQ